MNSTTIEDTEAISKFGEDFKIERIEYLEHLADIHDINNEIGDRNITYSANEDTVEVHGNGSNDISDIIDRVIQAYRPLTPKRKTIKAAHHTV